MIQFFYNIGIHLYYFAVLIASLWNGKAKKWINGQRTIWENLPNIQSKKVVWFHCASLGEFDQAIPLIRKFKDDSEDYFILVTFYSPSGMEHYHKRKAPVDYACYLPIDTASNARRFIDHIQPDIAIFIKYEFWINFIAEIHTSKIPLYSVSTILRPNQRFFKPWGSFFRKAMHKFDFFFVQNEETKSLLGSIGINNAEVTGDTRFDKVIEGKKNLVQNEELASFIGSSKKVFIIGSSWPKDEMQLASIINQQNAFDKIIIAPHDISNTHLKQIEQLITVPYVRFTQLAAKTGNEKVCILDTIGHLASAYSFGSLAYVGGGFSGNLHNILEPAVFGLPVIFGPKHTKFPEAQNFIEHGIGFSIHSTQEIQNAIDTIQSNHKEISDKTASFVQENTGAASRIYSHIKLLPTKNF